MKIVHIGGGLGNQMANYATYLGVKLANPNDTIYFETLTYDIKDFEESCCLWNGYELEKIFGIKLNDIKNHIPINEYRKICQDLGNTKFWNDGSEAYAITNMLKRYGFKCQEISTPTNDQKNSKKTKIVNAVISWTIKQSGNIVAFYFRRAIFYINKLVKSHVKDHYAYKKRGDYYYPGCSFEIMKSKELQNIIGDQLRNDFTFPPFTDKRNVRISEEIQACNSVSIHARRSDFLVYNSDCYKYGYFKKAVSYIKKHVNHPVFYIFSEDSAWCKENLKSFGLNKNDQCVFVDWNIGDESYRDMQLMSLCKHNIATKSSFGWWASFLNKNPNKITCMQYSEYTSTKQF